MLADLLNRLADLADLLNGFNRWLTRLTGATYFTYFLRKTYVFQKNYVVTWYNSWHVAYSILETNIWWAWNHNIKFRNLRWCCNILKESKCQLAKISQCQVAQFAILQKPKAIKLSIYGILRLMRSLGCRHDGLPAHGGAAFGPAHMVYSARVRIASFGHP